jgi:hypothetical protein
MKKLGLEFFDIEEILNLEEGDLKEIDGKPFLVQREDPIKLNTQGVPTRTWVLEGVSRDWKIDITLQAGESELKKFKESD